MRLFDISEQMSFDHSQIASGPTDRWVAPCACSGVDEPKLVRRNFNKRQGGCKWIVLARQMIGGTVDAVLHSSAVLSLDESRSSRPILKPLAG